MPTVLRIGRYRFSFFSNEGNEAPHVHIHASGDQAKFWLEPIGLVSNYGFNVRELNEIEDIVEQNQVHLLEVWREYFEK